MRLIDADEMLKRLEEWNTNDKMDRAVYNFTWKRIMEQPTAYDVENVVAKLIERTERVDEFDSYVNGKLTICTRQMIPARLGIEIVQQGYEESEEE